VPLHWHGHDDFGLAVAGSLAAVEAGADWVQGTVNGMGERAGNTDLPTFALALEALYAGQTGFDFSVVTDVAETVRSLSGYTLAPWKPVTGRNLFVRESGAVAAQFHQPAAVEPYSSTIVGARRAVVLGKKSGLASIQINLDELGLSLDAALHPVVLERVKTRGAEKRGLVTQDEFRQMVAEAERGRTS
jgi:isopropylmalate/homocitrate/citramalate synthase